MAPRTLVTLAQIGRKAILTKKKARRRLKYLTLLAGSPEALEGGRYAFLTKFLWLQEIHWRARKPWGTERTQMEAVSKMRVGLHQKEQHLDLHCLPARQGCLLLRFGIGTNARWARTYCSIQGLISREGLRPFVRCWLQRDALAISTVSCTSSHCQKGYITALACSSCRSSHCFPEQTYRR